MAERARRQNARGGRSRERILEATLSLAAEHGYDGTTISMVSGRTGLPASSIYWHFKDKDHLVASALEHGAESWRSLIPPTPAEPPDDVHDVVVRGLRAAIALTLQQPDFWHLGLSLVMMDPGEELQATAVFRSVYADFVDGVAQWWRALLAASSPTEEQAQDLARSHLAVMQGFYIAHGCGTGHDDLHVLADLVAHGLLSQARDWGLVA